MRTFAGLNPRTGGWGRGATQADLFEPSGTSGGRVSGGGPQGGTLILSYIRRLGSFLGG